MTHEIRLKGYRAEAEGRLYLGTAGSYGMERLHVTADEAWEGMALTAVFTSGTVSTKVLVGLDGCAVVPQEATARPAGSGAAWYIVFEGVREGARLVSAELPYYLEGQAPPQGEETEPTQDRWSQFVAEVREDRILAAAAAEEAGALLNQAEETLRQTGEEQAERLRAEGDAQAERIENLAALIAPLYGVRFQGAENTGEAVSRLYDAAGLSAGVGSETQRAENGFDGVYPWSARRRCCGYFDERGSFIVNAYAGEPGYATDGSKGEVWVEHSLFYYKHSYEGDAEEILLSSLPLRGFLPAPIFLRADGSILPKAYTAAYPMAVVDGRATSRAGVFSQVCSLNEAMEAARTLGERCTVGTTAEWYTECLYMWVEFATRNLQSVMAGATSLPYASGDTAVLGEAETNRVVLPKGTAAKFVVGQTICIGSAPGNARAAENRIITSMEAYDGENTALSFDGPPAAVAAGDVVWSSAWINGSCDGVLSSSGSPILGGAGKYNYLYRGREAPYGNAFEWVCDLLFTRQGAGTESEPYRYEVQYLTEPWEYAGGAVTEKYKKLEYNLSPEDGFVKRLGLDSRYPHVRLPAQVGGTSSTYYSDYYYKPASPVSAGLVGGYWASGSGAGPCFWHCGYAPSTASAYRRARLSRGG